MACVCLSPLHLSSCDKDRLCCVLLSLCGMSSTCVTIGDTVGSVEGSVAWLRDWSSTTFLASLLSTLANITGGRRNCKDINENIFSFIMTVARVCCNT